MNKFERENIKHNFLQSLQNAWTWKLLTMEEKERITNALNFSMLFGNKTKDVYIELNTIYNAFLLGLDYKPIGWRENKQKEGE